MLGIVGCLAVPAGVVLHEGDVLALGGLHNDGSGLALGCYTQCDHWQNESKGAWQPFSAQVKIQAYSTGISQARTQPINTVLPAASTSPETCGISIPIPPEITHGISK